MKFSEWIMLAALVIAAGSALAREPEHDTVSRAFGADAGSRTFRTTQLESPR
jgi:hypothetical protein